MASGPADVEEASDVSEAEPEWRRDLDAWMGRSDAHVRTWNRFTRRRRRSDDPPVIVDQELIESFAAVREFLLRDELDECMLAGQAAQRGRVRHSCEFTQVTVRRTPDMDSAMIGSIMPGGHCIQRGALMALDGKWTGVVRMPIHPEGWITYRKEAAARGTMFVDRVDDPSEGTMVVDLVDDPSEDSKERWSCSVCTFENEGRDSKCDICGVPRPHACGNKWCA